MIKIQSQVAHQLDRHSALKRMREFVATLPQRFPHQVHQVTMQIQGDSVEVRFSAYGYLVHWKAEMQDSSILLHGWLPDSAKRFQHKMLQTMVDRVSDALRPAATTTLRCAA